MVTGKIKKKWIVIFFITAVVFSTCEIRNKSKYYLAKVGEYELCIPKEYFMTGIMHKDGFNIMALLPNLEPRSPENAKEFDWPGPNSRLIFIGVRNEPYQIEWQINNVLRSHKTGSLTAYPQENWVIMIAEWRNERSIDSLMIKRNGQPIGSVGCGKYVYSVNTRCTVYYNNDNIRLDLSFQRDDLHDYDAIMRKVNAMINSFRDAEYRRLCER